MEAPGRLLESCVSTNDEARKWAEEGAPEGAWVSARTQSGGRGRLGRQWTSESGNLFLSIIVRSPVRSHWTWVPVAAAVGAAGFLKARFPSLDLKIKWPNDIVTSSGKLAGILCESVGSRDQSFIVIGIGLNCRCAPEVTGPFLNATSLSSEVGTEISADEIRPGVVSAVLDAVRLLSQGENGASEVSRRYDALALLSRGKAIEWQSAAGEVHAGKVIGLGKSGELLVERDGAVQSLYAEDVRIRAVPKAAGESPA